MDVLLKIVAGIVCTLVLIGLWILWLLIYDASSMDFLPLVTILTILILFVLLIVVQTKQIKTMLKGIALILCAIPLLVLWWSALLGYEEYQSYRGVKFTKEAWSLEGAKRCKMYSNLITHHLKKGMASEEVRELLGKEDGSIYCMYKNIKCFNYWLGTCYSRTASLKICFNDENKLIGIGKGDYAHEVCDYKEAYCKDDKECECYMKTDAIDRGMPEKCPFEIKRW